MSIFGSKKGHADNGPERVKEPKKPLYMRNYKDRGGSAFTKMIMRSITTHAARFLSVFAIIALGAGVYAGLRAFIPDMYKTVDAYYDETHFYDLQINSTLGLTDDDLEAVQALDEIDQVEGGKSAEVTLDDTAAQGTYYTSLMSMDPEVVKAGGDSYINRIVVVEGRLPEKNNEIAISLGESVELNRIEIGDVLEVASVTGASSVDKILEEDSFEVVGFVHSPHYVSTSLGLSLKNGSTINRYAFVPIDAFTDTDIYTDMYATVSGAKKYTAFTENYKDHVEQARLAVKDLAPERENARNDEIIGEAQEKIQDAKDELRDSRQEYEEEVADAQQELADAEKELEDGRAELADAEKAYEDGMAQVQDGKAQIATAEDDLRKARSRLAGEKHAAYTRLNESKKQLDEAKKELASSREQLDASKKELDDAEKQVATLTKEAERLNEAERRLDEAQAGIEQMEAALSKLGVDIKDIPNEIKALEAKLETLRSEKIKAENGVAELEQNIATLEQQKDSLLAQNPPPEDLEAQVAAIDTQISKLTQQKQELQTQLSQVNAGIDKASDGLKKLKEASQLADNLKETKQKHEDGRAKWQSGMERLNAALEASGYSSVDEAVAQHEQGKQLLEEGEAAYRAGNEQYQRGLEQYQAGKAEADSKFSEAENEIAAGQNRLETSKKEIADAEAELATAKSEIADARTEIADGEQELADGKQELADKMAEAEEEFADAEKDIAEAERDLEDIDDALWYILTRDANAAANIYSSNAERIDSITTIFPIFFFLVAGLVSLTTMTRMVESERMEIGTLKSLGYKKLKISSKYLLFAASAALLGAVFGIAIGTFVLPYAIWLAYSVLYRDLSFQFTIALSDSILAFALSLGLSLLATAAASAATLREKPTSLMLPRAPKPGKRILLEHITPLWKRMRFSYKVTARNLFRYKGRLIMTILGVAGCTGLLLTGFDVRDNLETFIPDQFNKIYQYNVTASFDLTDEDGDEELRQEELDDVIAELKSEPEIDSWLLATRKPAVAENPTGDPEKIPFGVGGEVARTGGSAAAQMRAARSDASEDKDEGILRDITIIVPEDASELPDFVYLVSASDKKKELTLQPGEVIITQRLSEQLLLEPGDDIYLSLDTDEESQPVTVSAIAHYYVGHDVYMDASTYEQVFDKESLVNGALIKGPKGEIPSRNLAEKLKSENEFISNVTTSADESGGYANITDSLGAIVGVIIGVSGALAFIVLYNLTNINIEERRREIATIKVLGFYPKEVNGYVFRETFILSIMATVLGLPLGVALSTFIMRSAELDNIMFSRYIHPLSYVIAAALTIVFTAIVALVMSKKLKDIDMVSSLKANE